MHQKVFHQNSSCISILSEVDSSKSRPIALWFKHRVHLFCFTHFTNSEWSFEVVSQKLVSCILNFIPSQHNQQQTGKDCNKPATCVEKSHSPVALVRPRNWAKQSLRCESLTIARVTVYEILATTTETLDVVSIELWTHETYSTNDNFYTQTFFKKAFTTSYF